MDINESRKHAMKLLDVFKTSDNAAKKKTKNNEVNHSSNRGGSIQNNDMDKGPEQPMCL